MRCLFITLDLINTSLKFLTKSYIRHEEKIGDTQKGLIPPSREKGYTQILLNLEDIVNAIQLLDLEVA